MKGQQLRQQQMASLGRLLADFSHEMRNHLAVMQEANGLLQDILTMQGDEAPPFVASLKDTAAQIGKRVRTCA
ncbi:MAG: sensor histidine kinase, partial [Candidatus Electrothrix sp. AUS3]|nr:sensor histidine kinase [Candidatus Electrothrix gigas]